MKESTRLKYLKSAQTFYETYFKYEQPTAKKIADKLIEVAPNYRPDSWRNLKNSIRLDQSEKGYSKAVTLLNSIKNPTTDKANPDKQPVKQGRNKTTKVSNKDMHTIMRELSKPENLASESTKDTGAAIIIAKLTGCRPAEMSSIKVFEGSFLITSAKKTEDGERGLDRKIKVKDDAVLAIAVSRLRDKSPREMKNVADNVNSFMKRTFPRRATSTRPNLYAFRHQMASDLKAANTPLKTASYIMGHQVTQSIERYGNRRSGSGGHAIEAAETVEKIDNLVFDNKKPFKETRPSREAGNQIDSGPTLRF